MKKSPKQHSVGRLSHKLKNRNDNRWLYSVVLTYMLSRVILYFSGIEFNSGENMPLINLLSVELLKNDLINSIVYLHSQPPLFNVLIGIVHKIFGGYSIFFFKIFYLGMGLLISLSIFLLMKKLGVRDFISGILTILFFISPSSILFENILFYTYPVVAMLCFSAFFLHLYISEQRALYGLIFFLIISCIILTRSLYHVIWFIAVLSLVLYHNKAMRRQIVIISLFPLFLIMLWYGKNLILFDSFSSSFWLGMSMSKMTTMQLDNNVKLNEIQNGLLSELSLLPPFKGLWEYRDKVYLPNDYTTGIQALDEEQYITGGNNLNNILYIGLSKTYMKDALHVIKIRPGVYAKSILNSFKLFFYPASDWFSASSSNRSIIYNYETMYNLIVLMQVSAISNANMPREYNNVEYSLHGFNMAYLIVIKFITALVFGLYLLTKLHGNKQIRNDYTSTVLYLFITIVYVSFFSSILDIGENQRFRYNIEPFLVILFGLSINYAVSYYINFKAKK